MQGPALHCIAYRSFEIIATMAVYCYRPILNRDGDRDVTTRLLSTLTCSGIIYWTSLHLLLHRSRFHFFIEELVGNLSLLVSWLTIRHLMYRPFSQDPEAVRLFIMWLVLSSSSGISSRHSEGRVFYIYPRLIESPFTAPFLLSSAIVHGNLLKISAERCLSSAN